MHITIITFSGLVLLALMLYIGDPIGFSRQTMAYRFAALWLAMTLINGAVGVVHAGGRWVRKKRLAAGYSACRQQQWCCSCC